MEPPESQFSDFDSVAQKIRLFRSSVPVSKMLIPSNLVAEKARILNEVHKGELSAPDLRFQDDDIPLRQATRLATEVLRSAHSLPDGWAAAIEKDTLRRLSLLEVNNTHDAERISCQTEGDYGRPSQTLLAFASRVLKEQPEVPEEPVLATSKVVELLSTYLDDEAFEGWSVKIVDSMYAKMSVTSEQRELRISAQATLTRSAIDRLVVHELGTHVLRRINAQKQKNPLLSTPIGVSDPTEEGLALINEDLLGQLGIMDMKKYSLRVLAAEEARTGGFTDVMSMLLEHTDPESAVDIAFRAKRGIRNIQTAGAHFKDISYLAGYLEVKEHLRHSPDDYGILMSVKQPLDMLPVVKSMVNSGDLVVWPVQTLDEKLPGPYIDPVVLTRDRGTSSSWLRSSECVSPFRILPQTRSGTDAMVTASLAAQDAISFRRPLRIENLTISGDLDLEGMDGSIPLILSNCHIEGAIKLSKSHLKGLILRDCSAQLIDISSSTIDGDLLLDNCDIGDGTGVALKANLAVIGGVLNAGASDGQQPSWFKGEVDLELARVSGRLDLNAATIEGFMKTLPSGRKQKVALSLTRAHCMGGVRLRGAYLQGQLRGVGLKAGGQLNFKRLRIENSEEQALVLERVSAASSLLAKSMEITGGVSLKGAEIKGSIILSDCSFTHKPDAVALNLNMVTCQSINLSSNPEKAGQPDSGIDDGHRVSVRGKVSIESAEIARDLLIDSLSVSAQGTALSLDGACVGGRIRATKMKLESTEGEKKDASALTARGLIVTRDCDFSDSTFQGNLILTTMKIGRYFSLQSVKVSQEKLVLNFPSSWWATDDEYVALESQEKLVLNLQSSTIGSDLNLKSSSFGSRSQVSMKGATVSGTFVWKEIKGAPRVDLDSAFVHELDDDPESWDPERALNLEGFSFDQFGESDHSSDHVRRRINWLSRQESFSPGPYERLAQFYAAIPNSAGERMVMLALQKERIRDMKSRAKAEEAKLSGRNKLLRKIGSWFSRAFWWIWFLLTGNGYRLIGVVILAVLVLLVSVSLAFWAQNQGLLIPADVAAAQSGPLNELAKVSECTKEYPCFNPLVFGVDAVVPVIEFNQEQFWVPDLSTRPGTVYSLALPVLKVLGWVTVSISAGGIVQRFRK